MIACIDVDYGESATTAALVAFRDWSSWTADVEIVDTHPPDAAAYRPGAFFERELPYLLPTLAKVSVALVIVDGYVMLGPERPGLGAHLHAAIAIPVIGVAKTRFADAPAIEISRHATRPLYVTAIGVDVVEAAASIAGMHGPYRIPTMLKRADSLARRHALPIA